VNLPKPNQHETGRYELRVDGHLDDHWAEWFGELRLRRETDGTTTLSGPVTDHAALHSYLIKIRDLGLVLISVRTIHNPSDPVVISDLPSAPDTPHSKREGVE
jgi:hypothetical protein